MRNYFDVNRIHRDKYHRKISGVCSGLARHWQQPRWIIRVAAVLCFIALPVATAVAYVTAIILLPER
ncbi:MAG: PspC domain-containing protein [Paraglaciecola sp.]|jgi:phage shock protein C|nr:PspC domain-containing protein [Paraglaciecola sp.]NCT47652.1 PspC domain-containing protein [Paraglaciecola sp.]